MMMCGKIVSDEGVKAFLCYTQSVPINLREMGWG
jgi:hypothetical protein